MRRGFWTGFVILFSASFFSMGAAAQGSITYAPAPGGGLQDVPALGVTHIVVLCLFLGVVAYRLLAASGRSRLLSTVFAIGFSAMTASTLWVSSDAEAGFNLVILPAASDAGGTVPFTVGLGEQNCFQSGVAVDIIITAIDPGTGFDLVVSPYDACTDQGVVGGDNLGACSVGTVLSTNQGCNVQSD